MNLQEMLSSTLQFEPDAQILLAQSVEEARVFFADSSPVFVLLAAAKSAPDSSARQLVHRAFGSESVMEGEYDAFFEYLSHRQPLRFSELIMDEQSSARCAAHLRRYASDSAALTAEQVVVAALGSMNERIVSFFEFSGRSMIELLEEIDAPHWIVDPYFDYGVPTP